MTAIAPLPAKLSYEEYRTLPDDGRRYELIDGELFMFAGPSISHQFVSLELAVLFRSAVKLRGLGHVLTVPAEVKFPGDNAVQPDLVVVLYDRAHIFAENRIEGAPSLVLEILSPSPRSYDLSTKANFYARHGVPEYWIVDFVAETITVYELRDGLYVPLPGGEFVRSRVVPDLAVDVRALFAAARL